MIREKKFNQYLLLLTLVVTIVALILQLGAGYSGLYSPTWGLVTSLAIIISVKVIVSMIATIKAGSFGVDILALTAIVTTLFVNDSFSNVTIDGYWSTLMILIMLTGGESLEDYAHNRAHKELQALLDNSPSIAHKIVDGKLVDLKVDDVKIDDHLLVKPGEMVPVDGLLSKGSSVFDQSSITGESTPVRRNEGDKLLSGSINGDVAIELKVNKLANDSQYQTIVNLVKEAESKPAHFVRIADRYAIPFTLISFFIAGLAWGIPAALGTITTTAEGLSRFTEVLVVASPCPLILAAPIALISGMSRTSKNGVIVKNADALEILSRAKTIAFDKTGTITQGTLLVDQILPEGGFAAEDLLKYAASAEQNSNHIFAHSLLLSTQKMDLYPVQEVLETPGQGLTATVNGKKVMVGKPSFTSSGKDDDHLDDDGMTKTHVSIDDQCAGVITFKDQVRPEAKQTIDELKELGVKDFFLLTGDNEKTAAEVAKEVGINNVKANCLPQEKIAIIKGIPAAQRPLVMIGDGVNDAPSLAAADVGIAMGAKGSTAATQSADMVIMLDDIAKVGQAMAIAKNTLRIAKQSVLLGISVCLLLEVIAAFGVIPALIGAIAQEGIDVLSILSALRANSNKKSDAKTPNVNSKISR